MTETTASGDTVIRLRASDWTGDRPAPESWYLLARGDEIPLGKIVAREFLGRKIVLFRGSGGKVAALGAFCPHLGTYLGHGDVVGDRIRCPLHHWEFDGEGVCRHIPAAAQTPVGVCQSTYCVEERHGGVWVFHGDRPRFPPPDVAIEVPRGLAAKHGRTVRLACPWFLPAINGFDVQHLEKVHARTLREPAEVLRHAPHRISIRCIFAVTSGGLLNGLMKALSGNRIGVTISCWGGNNIVVESDLGRLRSGLIFSIVPTPSGCEIRPIYFAPAGFSGILNRVRLFFTGLLYHGFLRHDIRLLEGMRFRPNLLMPADDVLGRMLRYLNELPRGSETKESPGTRARIPDEREIGDHIG